MQLKDKRLELLRSSRNKPSGMFCTTTQSRKVGCRSSHTHIPSVTKCGLLTLELLTVGDFIDDSTPDDDALNADI